MSKKPKTSPIHLSYWCKTSVIDEIVCNRKGVTFRKALSDLLDASVRHYFVVDKKGNFKIVSGVEFEKHFDNKEAPVQEQTPEALKAINAFILKTHGI